MMYPYLILNKHYLGKLINDGGGSLFLQTQATFGLSQL